ncbi:MAG: hypothetical protein AB2541_17355 [Candidatus Thiodiazotropha sp.]
MNSDLMINAALPLIPASFLILLLLSSGCSQSASDSANRGKDTERAH